MIVGMVFSAYHVLGTYLLVEDVWRHLGQLNRDIKTYIYIYVKYFNNKFDTMSNLVEWIYESRVSKKEKSASLRPKNPCDETQ